MTSDPPDSAGTAGGQGSPRGPPQHREGLLMLEVTMVTAQVFE